MHRATRHEHVLESVASPPRSRQLNQQTPADRQDERAAPRPRDLRGAASVARSLAYAVGLAGVVAGAVVYRSAGEVTLALVIWVITFAAGALLMIAAFLCEGVASLLARTASLEQELRLVTRRPDDDEDPWTGGHPRAGGHPNRW